ncbi:MAG: type II toxin-antitoxin system RelE/ParE family toxin [Fimbriiglobus sp.]
MAALIWSPQAISDVTDITNGIGRRNPNAARRFAATLYALVGDLRTQPHLGAMVPEYLEPLGPADTGSGRRLPRL